MRIGELRNWGIEHRASVIARRIIYSLLATCYLLLTTYYLLLATLFINQSPIPHPHAHFRINTQKKERAIRLLSRSSGCIYLT